MVREYLKNKWRKLDNTAKIFSLEADNNINIFRYSVVLKKNIDKNILLEAVNRTLDDFPMFKVRVCSGVFWNYLEYNTKDVVISKETDKPCNEIDFKANNDYLFRVTYYKNKINLDIFHILTDGTGASYFIKSLVYNYLDIKYKMKVYKNSRDNVLEYQDQYLVNFDKSDKTKYETDLAYQIKGKILDVNNTYHFTVTVNDMKKVTKKYGVSITEFLTALYIYALYTSIYDGESKKEIIINVPVNLRKYYNVDTLSNFFVCMDINPKLLERSVSSFDEALMLVHEEFSNKLTTDKVKSYLNRDVRLGLNLPMRLVPLSVKKFFITLLCKIINRTITSTVSNVGVIDIDEKYREYIDNVYVLVLPGKVQKIKCTICSYNGKLNITMNSNIDDFMFEKRFYELLKSYIESVKVISNTDNKFC